MNIVRWNETLWTQVTDDLERFEYEWIIRVITGLGIITIGKKRKLREHGAYLLDLTNRADPALDQGNRPPEPFHALI